MFYALSWFAVASLLALWSLTAWALHSIAVWVVSNAGTLSGAATGAGSITLPEWLAPWVPAEMTEALNAMLASLGPLVERLLEGAPALAGVLTVATWALWGIGSVLLVLLGAGLHLLIALWRRRGGRSGGGGAGTSLAAG